MYVCEPKQVAEMVRNRVPGEDMLLRLTEIALGIDVIFALCWEKRWRSYVAMPTVCQDGCWYSARVRVPDRGYYLIKRHLRQTFHIRHLRGFELITVGQRVPN